ncbi:MULTISPECIES: lipoyl synthase [unclassified Porphyromonas]|uniref:lipoyl synthase n=1 Tax=unclassified Porphyromonas TaxID=2645799 RepID=UPI00052D397C|nr:MULTISPECIES: lipoyl synthase [unclassified Porphyromonas]KGN85814.1 lipoyl synthase [Porphyromonas sp. COT-290 OH860]KGO00315.1 lipoyl synthase [Porphyromonas sp. COT-290 OH3588]
MDNSKTTKTGRVRKPEWLKIKLGDNSTFTDTKTTIEGHGLNTICTSGRCPNLGECWSAGTATFMIGGAYCTRACRFCNTLTSRTPPALDPEEPQKVADSIKTMGLRHAVITSVDRDDLPDYGAAHWVATIEAIQRTTPEVTIEVLIPDFNGNLELVDKIIALKPRVISHNLETVRRLTPSVRHVATYDMSLRVLERIASSGVRAKTGIMLGLGESEEEVLELMDDIKRVGVSVLTIGQYLQPTRKHLPVVEYVHPKQFAKLRILGMEKKIPRIESGPLVRSSYHAERHT